MWYIHKECHMCYKLPIKLYIIFDITINMTNHVILHDTSRRKTFRFQPSGSFICFKVYDPGLFPPNHMICVCHMLVLLRIWKRHHQMWKLSVALVNVWAQIWSVSFLRSLNLVLNKRTCFTQQKQGWRHSAYFTITQLIDFASHEWTRHLIGVEIYQVSKIFLFYWICILENIFLHPV